MRIAGIGQRMFLGFGGVLLLWVAFSTFYLVASARVNRLFSFVIEHDAPVIANARQLGKLVVDMETGQRGFIITGKDEFMVPYDRGRARFAVLIAEEKELVNDNPDQVSALEDIESLVGEWVEKAALPEMAMRRKILEAIVDAQYLERLLAKGTGKAIVDSMRAMLDELKAKFNKAGDKDSVILVLSISKGIVDMETGQRGFIITGDESFLEPNRTSRKQVMVDLVNLRSLTGNDKTNAGLIDQLESSLADWLERAEGPEIAARREMNENTTTLKDVAALLEAETGKRILDRIRSKLDDFVQVEQGLMAERSAQANRMTRLVKITAISTCFLTIAVSAIIAFYLTRSITRPIGELAGAATIISQSKLPPPLKIRTQDEVGQLGIAFNKMVADIRDSQSRYHGIVENAVDGIVTVDTAGDVELFNPAAELLFGYGVEEVIGHNMKMLMPAPYNEEYEGYLERYMETGETSEKIFGIGREVTGQRKDGSTFPMELTVSKVVLGEKQIFTGIVRGITDCNKREE
jgi:methyl-accepting chemotaxis protein